jgi:hypothetical protein
LARDRLLAAAHEEVLTIQPRLICLRSAHLWMEEAISVHLSDL